MVAFAWLWGLLVAQRLAEVARARRHTRRLLQRGAREYAPGHYPIMVALHCAWFAGWLAEVLIWGAHWQTAWLAPALAGQGLRWWAQNTLGERWTTRILVIPQEQPVSGGPFRFLRHPNYIGVVLELGSFPMLLGAWRSALVFSLANAILMRWRITMEEQAWKQSGN